MRTTIIPAQITTVEDKIAGSLSLSQILILIIPVLWTAFVYVLLTPSMKLTSYKFGLILMAILICITLSIRIKDKIVVQWLQILVRYQLRPRYWIYNKNELTERSIDLPPVETRRISLKRNQKKQKQAVDPELSVADLVRIEHLIDSGKVAVLYQTDKKHR